MGYRKSQSLGLFFFLIYMNDICVSSKVFQSYKQHLMSGQAMFYQLRPVHVLLIMTSPCFTNKVMQRHEDKWNCLVTCLVVES